MRLLHERWLSASPSASSHHPPAFLLFAPCAFSERSLRGKMRRAGACPARLGYSRPLILLPFCSQATARRAGSVQICTRAMFMFRQTSGRTHRITASQVAAEAIGGGLNLHFHPEATRPVAGDTLSIQMSTGTSTDVPRAGEGVRTQGDHLMTTRVTGATAGIGRWIRGSALAGRSARPEHER